MAYDATKLKPNDPTDSAWAIAWVRFLTGDRVEPAAWSDSEITAALAADAFTLNSTTYYRPHVTAASLVASDPDRPDAESTLGASVTNRNASDLARAIRQRGRWIDALIADTSGTWPTSTTTLEVVW